MARQPKRGTRGNYNIRRVSFVLSDSLHKLTLVAYNMKVRLKSAEFDHNVYEGPILEAWRSLPLVYRKLDFVGVLVSDTSKEYRDRIQWVVEADPLAEAPGLTVQEMLQALSDDSPARGTAAGSRAGGGAGSSAGSRAGDAGGGADAATGAAGR